MREFSWKYFSYTGQIDAYLLFKDLEYIVNIKEFDIEEESKEEQSFEQWVLESLPSVI